MTPGSGAMAVAARVAADRARLARLVRAALAKARRHRGALRAAADDLAALIALVRARVRGEYRQVPWRSLVAATAALVYFVNPFDAIPDTILLAGLVDDVAVIGLVAAAIRRDLEQFRRWDRAGRSRAGAAAP